MFDRFSNQATGVRKSRGLANPLAPFLGKKIKNKKI